MLRRPRKLAIQFYRRCLARLLPKTGPGPRQPNPLPQPPLLRILLLSIGFKPNQPTTHTSPSLLFAHTLAEMGCARLVYHDPLIPASDINIGSNGGVRALEKLPEACWNAEYIDSEFDGLAICNRQESVDMGVLAEVRRVFVQSFV